MSRIVNISNPGKLRDQNRRTIAEALRLLMYKRTIDEEARDLAATIVFSLREIHKTIEVTTTAWEDRDYYLKADRFRLDWEWVKPAADRLQEVILKGRWAELPEVLAQLLPKFADISIAKMTRTKDTWESAYQRLLESKS
ncbi:MAG: hypothetical protein ACYC6L_13725 [Anaerolineae bacterium]